MKNDQFDNLKERLDKEAYGTMRFSNDEKDKVLHRLVTSEKKKKPIFNRMVVSFATIAVLIAFGLLLLNEGLVNNESASEQSTEEQISQTDKTEPKDAVESSDSDSSVAADGGLSKEWKDVTNPEDVPNTHPESAKEMIAKANETINATTPEQYQDDPMYYDAMGAGILWVSLRGITVEGEAIERDFDNLEKLTVLIQMEEKKRYEHLDLPQGEWPQAYVEDWKEPSDTMEKAMMYFKGLLNDLDIAINHDGDGETAGYAHMIDGEKASELEAFLPPENELEEPKWVDE